MRFRALVVAVVAANGSPRDTRADVQQWTELGVDKQLTKRWSAAFEQHLRFDDGVSRVESVMPEIGVRYRLQRWLQLGAGYRLQYQREADGDMELRHRFHLAARARWSLAGVRFDYRLQLQEQLRPSANDSERHTIRNSAKASYRGLKPWVPSAAIESFHAIADEDGPAVELDKLWLTIGVEYAGNDWSADVFYRAELPIADAMDATLHIIGIGVHYDL